MQQIEVGEKKLAVIFPGIGYTVDKPLMYYSAKIAKNAGYEIKPIPYSGFPKKIIGDQDKMKESFEIAIKQARELLANVDFADYTEILFIGKSIGTVVALKIAMESGVGDHIRKILYTPVKETFESEVGDAIAFTGTNDPWVGGAESVIPKLCKINGILCHEYEHANHSLETGDVETDLQYLKDVLRKTEQFIIQKQKIKLGILSDTHGLLRPEVIYELADCDAILHGGDINKQEIIDQLNQIAPTYVVRGNNDKDWAEQIPYELQLELGSISVYMTHKKKDIPKNISAYQLVVYGHSHKYSEKIVDGTYFLNPGSCGPRRFDQDITMATAVIENGEISVHKIEIPHEKREKS